MARSFGDTSSKMKKKKNRMHGQTLSSSIHQIQGMKRVQETLSLALPYGVDKSKCSPSTEYHFQGTSEGGTILVFNLNYLSRKPERLLPRLSSDPECDSDGTFESF